MNIELSKMQLIHLRNICKKGWGGYSKPSDDLEEMVKWKSHSTLTLLATQNYPFLLKYDCPLWLK